VDHSNFNEISLSVNMITYNHENFIKDAIEGVLNQKCKFRFELIIADDCSKDKTSFIIEEIIKNHPKGNLIKYFRHSNNIGMVQNSNFALSNSLGEYIAICEGDDFWIDNLKLQKQYDFLINNPSYIYTTHRYKIFNENIKKYDDNIYPLQFGYYTNKDNWVELNKKLYLKEWMTMPLTAVIRKDFLLDVNKLENEFIYYRDFHAYYLLLNYGKGCCLDIIGGVYRKHDGGIFSKINILEKTKTSLKIYLELFYYTKDNNFLIKYWEAILVLLKRFQGFKILYQSFLIDFSLIEKFYAINALFLYFLDRLSIKSLNKYDV
jgi:glycosyltransferase involved in cell wall biosynthesis